jgi:uncharacterized protein YndB with AHSA1/START domain
MSTPEQNPTTDDATIVIARVFDAPRELVFDAWTDPEQVKRWFGPASFTNGDVEIDLRPGGRFRIVMISPDGTEGPTGGEFLEVSPPERLVYRPTTLELSEGFASMIRSQLELAGADPDEDKSSIVTVTFDEHEQGTLLTLHHWFASEAVRDVIRNIGSVGGWNEALDTLARELAAG